MRNRGNSLLVLLALGLASSPVYGLPTMVRLGYQNCSSCHITPQGAGLLNRYGRGIDQAQSLVGGEYTPWDSRFSNVVN